ncbi:MAG: hypothetical protein QG581_209, partial [Patescibacteria group bacterium]|nr:hypothetical protein [Patescibacteria group bacterium]
MIPSQAIEQEPENATTSAPLGMIVKDHRQ